MLPVTCVLYSFSEKRVSWWPKKPFLTFTWSLRDMVSCASRWHLLRGQCDGQEEWADMRNGELYSADDLEGPSRSCHRLPWPL